MLLDKQERVKEIGNSTFKYDPFCLNCAIKHYVSAKAFHKAVCRTTLSTASRSENSYLREAIEGGTVAPPRLSVINANGETDICSHCLRRSTDAMHRDVYGSLQSIRCSV